MHQLRNSWRPALIIVIILRGVMTNIVYILYAVGVPKIRVITVAIDSKTRLGTLVMLKS